MEILMRGALGDKLHLSQATLLALAATATVLAYWTGLNGPFIFDDYPNLRHIELWLNGKLGLSTLLFERGGGTFGRPVSMASFALNAKLLGYTPFSFKLGNLGLHLLIGALVFLLVRRLLQLDAALRPKAAWLSAATAALWLLHPLHASTVLYSVQRMAQLSGLIVLLGLGLYLTLRQKLVLSASWHDAAGLFLGILTLTAIGFLAKENGVLLPLLCCVVELSYFTHTDRPRSIKGFLWVFGAVPLVAAAVLFIARPHRIFGAYVGRDFDVYERLLSQGRAICDYVSQLLLPNPSRMGVFTDDFPISRGWLDPSTTAISFAALLIASVTAWRFRRWSPTVTFGWFFFLVAHSLEASFLPLELYYEHRNYLPSIGLLAAVVALFALTFARLAQLGMRVDRMAKVAMVGILLVFAIGAHGRALVWQNSVTIAAASLLSHPQSINANSYVLSHTIMLRDSEAANRIVATLMASERPRNRALAYLYRAYVGCALQGKANADDLKTFVELAPMPVTIPENQPFNRLYEITGKSACTGLPDEVVGSTIRRLADRAENEANQNVMPLRYQSAAFFARARDWASTEEQGRLAWRPSAPAVYAVPLVQALLGTGRPSIAKQIMLDARKREDASNSAEVDLFQQLEQQVELAERDLPTIQR